MATVLQNCYALRTELEQRMGQSQITADQVWWYGELVYRIGVLETCQMFCRSAPATLDVKTLLGHYQMMDAFIKSLLKERKYGPNRGPDTDKEREAATNNLVRVVQDYEKRFSSFAPTTPEFYGHKVTEVINTVLPAWLQVRNSYVPLKKAKEGDKK